MIMIEQTELKGGEILNHKLTHIDCSASVLEACRLMRKSGTEALLVTGEASGLLVSLGIVTASDIVTRVIAAELDPAVLTTGDITWLAPATPDSTARLTDEQEAGDEALAVLDGEGRLVGTVRRHELTGRLARHAPSWR